ncbi:insulinoma-associated protein 2 [Phaenicophaeus curvirostris]|uniref:insulinoma-associated protein 2 n=1 Tax=Phaenicophaeus curvirostris TaxID=33595 RepID=UPI0037F0E6DB
MPRGFLVKRSRRPGGSYRERRPERDPAPAGDPGAGRRPEEEEEEGGGEGEEGAAARPAARPPGAAPAEGPPAWGAAGPRAAPFERCLSSPAAAESFPPAAALPPAEAPPPRAPPSKARAKAPARRAKAARKPSFADEVTTSPVLGLRIKEEAPEGRPAPPAGRTPLGEFVCQLCKERYADPLALAQHRCSRIVRVEYRCPECHKIFSCPANLASHRRWHKPRPGPSADGSSSAANAAAAAAPGKENGPERRPAPQPPRQHRGGADSAPAPPGPAPAEAFSCPCCQKRFRRQAYLRKHLGTHAPDRAPRAFACQLCGARFPSADGRDKHGLWHDVREELLLPPPAAAPEGAERRGFPCKLCPAAFLSAPGLARHHSKCHPPEGRQVLLLQVPVRPGC